MASPLELAQYVQQQGELGRQRGLQTRFNRLAGQAYAAQPEQRAPLLAQAIETNPEAGFGLQKQLQGDEDVQRQRLAGAAKYLLNAFETKNQAAIQGAYRTIKPEFERLNHGTVLPDTVDESVLPMLHQVIAAAGGATTPGGAVQSTYIDGEGNRIAVMRDGTTKNLGPAELSNQIIEGAGGFYGVNKRNLQASPVTIGDAAPHSQPAIPQRMSDEAIVAFANQMSHAGVPQDQVEAWMRNQQSQPMGVVGEAPAAAPQSAPGAQLQGKGPSQIEQERLRLAQSAALRADEAAQIARQSAARGNAPPGFRFRPDGSLEPIPGGPKPAGAAASEDERKAAAWLAQAGNAYGNMTRILSKDPNADSPGVIETYSPNDEVANRSRSATRQEYVQAASSLSEALLRAATGAGITIDEARQKIREITPQRGDSQAVKEQKLRAIPVYIEALRQRAGRAAPQMPPSGPSLGAVEDGYRFKGGDPSNPANWEQVR